MSGGLCPPIVCKSSEHCMCCSCDFAFVVCFACMGNVCLCWSMGQNRCFLRRAHKCGCCKEIVTFNDPLNNSAETMVSKVQASNHCLHALLPGKKILNYTLRNSEYILPQCRLRLICTNVPSLTGVCLTCDNTMLSISSCCYYVFMRVCCMNLIKH